MPWEQLLQATSCRTFQLLLNSVAAHGLLLLAQRRLVPFEAVQWRVERAIRERGEPGDAHVDADGARRLRHWLLNLALSLDAGIPLAAQLADGVVPHRAKHVPAVAVAQPAQLGQEQAAVGLIQP